MSTEHIIDVEQNRPDRLELLRAQRFFYARAKLHQNFFTLMAILLPTIGVIVGNSMPAIRPYLGLAAILILLLDVWVISQKQREDCKRAAKLQEQFDTEVLQLDWNRLVAGGRVDAEEMRGIARRPMTDTEKDLLKNWYEPVISTIPLAVGRLLCQRTNVAYDIRVRATYSSVLLWSFILLAAILTAVGMHKDLKVNELILTMYLPALPLAAFLLREHRRQGDTIETLTTLKTEVERAWDKALSGASSHELTVIARALQDAIYRHRVSNPLVFDWLYNRLRGQSEDITRHGADKLVAEARQKLNLGEIK